MTMHLKNLDSKINQGPNGYKGLRIELTEFKNNYFLPFHSQMTTIDFTEQTSFGTAAQLLSTYMDEIDNLIERCNITSQSKFASSLIEDIPRYLFKDISQQVNRNIRIHNKGVFAGLQILDDFSLNVSTKDVDFCIGIKKDIILDGNELNIVIPFVCIEAKTYLDGTMIYEVQFSSDKLKKATSGVRTYVIMKYNQVGEERIKDAKANNILDEMFVIGCKESNYISPIVLQEIYRTICDDINRIGIEVGDSLTGRLLNAEN